jgi:4a-hydroxytetrahydrobiopterin dehydratase
MWQEIDNKLYQKFTFTDFVDAFAFMTKVAIISEKMNHHATITNTYNTVELWLTTHDKGNTITEKDKSLAEKISAVIAL